MSSALVRAVRRLEQMPERPVVFFGTAAIVGVSYMLMLGGNRAWKTEKDEELMAQLDSTKDYSLQAPGTAPAGEPSPAVAALASGGSPEQK
ncbi:hypothetical protein FVE85_0628 [Porphyridium purpureum]|uniref:Uncharacterized protein n=1 Tax=Porphyridium purpureum TaxID=35688 RepID=A0A5J4YZ41_PORPP|nr:hypothetical protein FVE85_0628 [Porphyridium purpureum]|eukprot:POR0807..scf208_2